MNLNFIFDLIYVLKIGEVRSEDKIFIVSLIFCFLINIYREFLENFKVRFSNLRFKGSDGIL